LADFMRPIIDFFRSSRTRRLVVINPLTGAATAADSLPVVLENDEDSADGPPETRPRCEFEEGDSGMVLRPFAGDSVIRLNGDEIREPVLLQAETDYPLQIGSGAFIFRITSAPDDWIERVNWRLWHVYDLELKTWEEPVAVENLFSTDELAEIFKRMAESNGLKADPALLEKVRAFYAGLLENEAQNFGNARSVRNLFECVLINQADRIASSDSLEDKKALVTFLPEDFPADFTG
jgi:hypothetical protein